MIIAVMTTICVLGTELSAHIQRVMIFAQVGALLLFAVVALVKGGALTFSLSWLSPFAIDSSNALILGVLTGVFIYWGWESAVNLNEETAGSDSPRGWRPLLDRDPARDLRDHDDRGGRPTRGSTGSPSSRTTRASSARSPPTCSARRSTSSWCWRSSPRRLSSTQTTILPASRTTLSMARQGAFPAAFGRVHPRFLTPHVSTIVIGAMAAVWFGVLFPLSENFVYDSLTALSLMIAFYYALTGFACAIYYRRELTKSVKNFLFIGVGPVVGSADARLPVLQGDHRVLEDRPESYSGSALFGIAIPVVLGVGLLLLGVVLMLIWRLGGHRALLRAAHGDGRSRRGRRAQGRHRRRPGGGGLMAARSCWATTPRPGAERRSTRRSSWPAPSATGW